MAEKTNIEWADSTLNWWIGCEEIGPGCTNCYAADWAIRYGRDFSQRTLTTTANRMKALKWQANHEKFFQEHGHRQRVFVNSLSDVFDNKVPREWRDYLWRVIRMCPNLDFLLLTKRVGNVAKMLPPDWGAGFHNVWLGISIVNQDEADRDIRKLVAIPAHCRFLSCEPLLGRIQINDPKAYGKVDWVIVGGESGPHARPMDVRWCLGLQNQCVRYGIAFFFKQGSRANWKAYKDPESFPRQLRYARAWPIVVIINDIVSVTITV